MSQADSRFRGEALIEFPFERPGGLVRSLLALVHRGCFTSLKASRGSFLHPSEAAAYERLEFDRRQRSYLLGRYALKRVACAWTGTRDPVSLEIVPAVLEYPVLKAPVADVPDLTLTHTEGAAAALAVEAGHATGIDLEFIDESRLKTFERVSTDQERSVTLPGLSAVEHAVLHWSLREALSKAVRCGFTVPFHVLELEGLGALGDGCFRCTFKNFGQYAGHAWIRLGHVFAVVHPKKSVPRPPARCWEDLYATGCFPNESAMLESGMALDPGPPG